MTAPRPRVVVSAQMSLDGRITLRRDHLLMTSPRIWASLRPPGADAVEAARTAQLALQQPTAVLEGSGSLVPSTAGPLFGASPASPALYEDFVIPAAKWFTVVDRRGRVRWTMTENDGYHLLVLVSPTTPAGYLSYLREEKISYLVGEDLREALEKMRSRLGVSCVVSNAGGGVNGALLRAGLVDEVQVVIYPALIGGAGTPTLFDGDPLAPGEMPASLRLLATHATADGTVWLRYEVLQVDEDLPYGVAEEDG
ncbi:dihydrofolate reductase family protein [Actinoplanes sp. NPDC048796]|uniref:dihydrofolate reductase family protein n=1 Tax=unclassified Actinoplanes TaxID=2626549 RepID=UPI0033EDF55C